MSRYQGQELELFQSAQNWKAYWSSKIAYHKEGIGLEVGAGIGANVNFLLPKTASLTVCEPDEYFCRNHLQTLALSEGKISVIVGPLLVIDTERMFDQIYYIDVLEHIKEDKQELINASNYLKIDGSLYILVPAHNFLYSKFDRSVGHFRRYNKRSLNECTPSNLKISEIYYLDSIGFFLSLANKVFSPKISFNSKKILFWDKILIPVSIKVDRVIRYRFGKSILVRMVRV